MHVLRGLRGGAARRHLPQLRRPFRAAAGPPAWEARPISGFDGAQGASMIRRPPRVLVIAGSDSGGGAGIQADIKTLTMLGGFATTAITAITAQNTIGVTDMMTVPTELVLAQIEAVVSDIGVDAVKIGMIGSAATARAVAERLNPQRAGHETAAAMPVVFDPVMQAS